MNYPDLIWHLIEMLLQKEDYQNQKNDEIKEFGELNVTKHDKTL